MAQRIYFIETPVGKVRLVNATTASQAIAHVARQEYKSRVATKSDLVSCITSGVTVEQTKEEV